MPEPSGLSVLSAMITPAVLISACGTLILSTSSRLGRVTDRVRRVTERFKDLAGGDAARERYAGEERAMLQRQIPRLTRRVRLLQRSLGTFYLAVGLFVLTSVVIGAVGLGGWSGLLSRQLPVLLGLAGAAFLWYGSLLLVLEARLSLETTFGEMQFLRDLAERYDTSGREATS